MEVKVIRSYTDKELNRNMQIGDVIDVTNERAKLLIEKDYVVALEVETTEPIDGGSSIESLGKPKKPRAKK
jgi:hypothetical protein